MSDFCVLLCPTKSAKLNCIVGSELNMCLEFWRFELRFCFLTVSLNNYALCEICVLATEKNCNNNNGYMDSSKRER